MADFGIVKFRKLLAAGSLAALGEYLMSFLGGAMSGNMLGELALEGVSIAAPVVHLLIFLSAMLGNGTGIIYSIRRGRLDDVGAETVFMQGIWTTLMVGLLCALLMFCGLEWFLKFLGASPEVAVYTRPYWLWLMPLTVLMPLKSLLLNVCYNDGDSQLAVASFITQYVFEIPLMWWLLKNGFGTSGCAISMIVGQVSAGLLLSSHFFRRSNTYVFKWRWCFRDSFRICAVAFGDASGYICDAIVYALLGRELIAQFGSSSISVFAAVILVSGLVNLSSGIPVALQPIISVYVGENNWKAVRSVVNSAFKIAIGFGLVVSTVVILCPEIVLMIVGIREPEVTAVAIRAVRITAVALMPLIVANVLNNYYQYIERESIAVALSFWMWLLSPLLSMYAFHGCDAVSYWRFIIVAHYGGILIFALILLWRFGFRKFPLLLDRERERKIHNFNFALNPLEITNVAKNAAAIAKANGITAKVVMRMQLLIEETMMIVFEKNANRRVLAEISLDFNDGMLLTLRDDGMIFDITDADCKVDSLRGFIVASMMERHETRRNLITTGFNRNVFRLV